MKMKRRFLLLAGCALLAAQVPITVAAAESEADARAIAALVPELLAQQKAITDNQGKIDLRLAEVAEELRTARIFVSRGGGKKP